MDNKWTRIGNSFRIQEQGTIVDKLPVGIYELETDIFGFYLNFQEEKFIFPYKVYGINNSLVKRVVKSFNSLNSNLGVLLNGVKGGGKTVTAKGICNEIHLPVIIIKKKFSDLQTFISSLQQDAVIFFDEYEKIYDDHDDDILTVMDGVLTTVYKKLFLLTTNEPWVNGNMLQRPSRIKYFKTFNDLDAKVITTIVDDMLTHLEVRDELIRFISSLEIITIDIVKCLVEECNLHQEGPSAFEDVFNVKKVSDRFDVLVYNGVNPEVYSSNVTISPSKITEKSVGSLFMLNEEDRIGEIVYINKDGSFVVNVPEMVDKEVLGKIRKASSGKLIPTTFKVEPYDHLHDSFYGYNF